MPIKVDLKRFSKTVIDSGAWVSLIAGVLVAVSSGVISEWLFPHEKVPTLSSQIAQVESALNEISRLSES